MFQLDDKFLEDVGLGSLSSEQRKPFLQHIYNELELRVGTSLSTGMSDAQLTEFELIIDRKDDIIQNWLVKNAPNYQDDESFLKLKSISGLDDNNPSLRAEYAATKWLEINRPDYKSVVANVLEELKKEIIASRDVILSNSSN